jgi:hypothetical protein
MCRLSLTVAAVALLLTGSASARPAPAVVFWDYPWCLQGKDWGYPGLCQFATYPQCLATASGTFSYCGINPLYDRLFAAAAAALRTTGLLDRRAYALAMVGAPCGIEPKMLDAIRASDWTLAQICSPPPAQLAHLFPKQSFEQA